MAGSFVGVPPGGAGWDAAQDGGGDGAVIPRLKPWA